MYLVDTDLVIWVLRNNQPYVEMLQKFKDKSSLSLSTVTIAEIYKNVFPSELARTEGVLDEFDTWDTTAPIAKQAGFYWQEYRKKLDKLSIIDCIIAATAREHDLILLTLNTRHFPMKDIRVRDPLKIQN